MDARIHDGVDVLRVFFYGIILPLSYLPLAVLYRFSDFFFYVMYYGIQYRKKVVRTSLKNSFPEKTDAEIEHLCRKFFRHLCDLIVESIKGFTISKSELRKRYKVTNPEFLEAYYQKGTRVMILGAHYANWEWSSIAVGLTTRYITYGIFTKLTNPFMDRVMKKSRERNGSVLIGSKEVVPTLRGSEPKMLTMGVIADQSPGRHAKHYWMKFLNQETCTICGYEFIAREFNLPVVYLTCKKVKRGYYECTYYPVTDNPRETKEGEIVTAFMTRLESIVRETPEFWLWSHNRWKIRKTA